MDKYQTFFNRLGAGIIDGIIFIPFSFLDSFTGTNKILFVGINLLYLLAWSVYTIGLHCKYGQTLGKKICNIRLYDIKETALLNVKSAFLRESVWIIAQLFILLLVTFDANTFTAQEVVNYSDYAAWVSIVWVLLDVLTILTNVKRRSLQDYLAHSVIIKIKQQTISH